MYQVCINIVMFCCLVFSGLSWSLDEVAPTVTPTPTVTQYEEGKHYLRLASAVVGHKSIQDLIAENPRKIQVIEFFNYGCFWCGRLRPLMDEWVKHKPETVVYYQFPLAFNKKYEVLAKAYYVTKALGKSETFDPEFFTAIHEKHVDLSDEKLLSAFFVEHGVPEKKFLDLYNSFTINKELAKANDIANAYQIILSPVIIINAPSGSYFLTAKIAGSEEALFSVLNYLVSRESKKLGG